MTNKTLRRSKTERPKNKKSKGFTLVELSLVLLIIGLLVGGIEAGIYMVRQAELRSVVTDFYTFTTAYNNFLDKYRFPPGDLPNADTVFNTSDCTTAGTCASSASVVGNGIIDYSTSFASDEINRAWKQAELGQTLSYGFDKLTNTIVTTLIHNAPPSKISGAGYIMIGGPDITPSPFGASTNGVFIGKQKSSNTLLNGALTPEDANNIDGKMDDGKATTGTVRAKDGADYAGGCVNPSTADYALNTTQNHTCRLGSLLG